MDTRYSRLKEYLHIIAIIINCSSAEVQTIIRIRKLENVYILWSI